MVSRGALIVVEGLDRAGKSTQVQRLHDNLRREGLKTEHMRFPDRTTAIGQSINSYLQSRSHLPDHSIHLLFSANRWEAADKIWKSIESGSTVIIDRYSYSGAVYSAAKQNPLLDLDWAWAPEVGLPQPDLVFFLTITPEQAKERGGYGDERYETFSMQERVRKLYDELLQRVPGNIQRINASGSLEGVEAEMLRIAKSSIENIEEPSFSRMLTLGHLQKSKTTGP